MSDVYIFVGPCLGNRHLSDLPETFTVFPPVTRGDIHQLIADTEETGVIAVIDGYFDHQLAVSHEELCAALDQGWRVWGMGGNGGN